MNKKMTFMDIVEKLENSLDQIKDLDNLTITFDELIDSAGTIFKNPDKTLLINNLVIKADLLKFKLIKYDNYKTFYIELFKKGDEIGSISINKSESIYLIVGHEFIAIVIEEVK